MGLLIVGVTQSNEPGSSISSAFLFVYLCHKCPFPVTLVQHRTLAFGHAAAEIHFSLYCQRADRRRVWRDICCTSLSLSTIGARRAGAKWLWKRSFATCSMDCGGCATIPDSGAGIVRHETNLRLGSGVRFGAESRREFADRISSEGGHDGSGDGQEERGGVAR